MLKVKVHLQNFVQEISLAKSYLFTSKIRMYINAYMYKTDMAGCIKNLTLCNCTNDCTYNAIVIIQQSEL